MRMALRWKIALSFTLLTAVFFGVLGAYLHSAVLRHTTNNMCQSLLAETHLALSALPEAPWGSGPELQDLVRELDERSGARLTLIDSEGYVLADSRHDPTIMENHADRPERLQALREGWGSSVRHSRTLELDMLYVAVAVPDKKSTGTVLRLAMPLTAVRAASRGLRSILVTAFVLAALAVWLVSAWLAGTLTAPVQRLVQAARRISRGDLQARAEGVQSGELAELAQVFNASVEQLAELVASSQREAEYYGAILENMTDAVVVIDSDRRVQFVNRTFARTFGVEAAAVQGQYVEQIALNYDLIMLLTRAVQQGAVQREEVRLLHPETRVLSGVAAPLVDENDQITGAVGLLHDITDLQRMDQVRRDFLSNASHELRTPAAGIKAVAEVLESGAIQDTEKGPRFVRQIVEAADRLTRTLDDMLTLTRVERAQEVLHPDWVAVSEAFAENSTQLQPAARKKGITLEVAAVENDRVYADSASLQTVLVNLLENAIKYTPAEGEVTLSGRVVPGGYEISVADTGVGIPQEHLPRIFERFYRVDPARDRATGGTGLGLSIVKHIVEQHGGTVIVRSTPGQGSTLVLFFPLPEPAVKYPPAD